MASSQQAKEVEDAARAGRDTERDDAERRSAKSTDRGHTSRTTTSRSVGIAQFWAGFGGDLMDVFHGHSERISLHGVLWGHGGRGR